MQKQIIAIAVRWRETNASLQYVIICVKTPKAQYGKFMKKQEFPLLKYYN
jgi:hypothetical protein